MCTGHNTAASPSELAGLMSRRGFLRAAAATTATTAALGSSAVGATPAHADDRRDKDRHSRQVPPEQISVQLFTLRDQLAIDLDGTFAALNAIGYTRVEHAGFVGRTAAQFKAALDANELTATSGHVSIPQPFNAAAWSAALADARLLGSRFIVHPFFGINFGTGEVVRTTAPWRAFAHDLNRAARMAADAGILLGYHNHNWEFFRLTDDPSRTAFDVLTEETDPDLVHLELDLFWAVRGARDPVDLIEANKGRVRQFHVKDMNQAGSFEDPGEGLLDFVRIFRSVKQSGLEYIVERDDAGTPPRQPADALTTADVGYDYLRAVRF
jgi:sugar phosphate isomerase/epimerase